jgi:hypothetical protein
VETTEEVPPTLRCFGGKPAPLGLGRALAQLATLPADARSKIEEMVLGSLDAASADQLDARLARLARRHELELEDVGPGIKSAAFLMREAASFDVGADALQCDVFALAGDAGVATMVAALYSKAKPVLRAEIVRSALVAHGKVLTGVEWRIDTLGSSDRGRKLNVPVALLTLHYQDGSRPDRVTVQVVPELLDALREVCNELLAG